MPSGDCDGAVSPSVTLRGEAAARGFALVVAGLVPGSVLGFASFAAMFVLHNMRWV